MIAAVVMAGGKGERFWPKSRNKTPKQLLSFTNDGKTLIQHTVERIAKIVRYDDIYIATNKDYSVYINKQLPKVPFQNIIVEPMSKNTAACIGLSALYILNKDEDAVMIVLPSDHLIKNDEKFLNIIKSSIQIAEEGEHIVTIGIKPTYPETGYGYIKIDRCAKWINSNELFTVDRFVEKPNKEKAEFYLSSGKYLWNSGIFVWKVSTLLNNIKTLMPELYKGLMKIDKALHTDSYHEVLYKEYSKLQSISIDYGIMEHTNKVFTIPGDIGWDDVGTWTALERIYNKDIDGNIINGNVVAINSKNCIVEGSKKLIATVGVEDLVVVDTDDAILICSKERCQNIKELLTEMKLQKKDNYL